MLQGDVQQRLAAGIEAVKRGQKARGRELLIQVVEADERNEQAWLWLSAAVDSPEDRITALQNVLDINPNNQVAHKELARLQPRPEEAPAPGQHAYAAAAPIESVSALDDPYQCLYCGALAAPDLRRCPECSRSLMVTQGSDRITHSVSSAVFVMLLCVAFAGIEAIALAILHFQGRSGFVRFLFTTWGLEHLFGNYLAWSAALAPIVFWIHLGWLVTLIAVLLAFLYQVTVAYYAAVGALGLNLLWVVYRWLNGFVGPALAVFDLLATLAALFFVFAAQPDFRVNRTRLRCTADPRIKGGEALHKLGLIYKKQGQWALAVAHWRAALAAMPTQPDFYKDLAIGYAQIGYYERSLRTLNEFARLRPDDPATASLKSVIEQKRTADPRPRG